MNKIRFIDKGNLEIVIGTGNHIFKRQTHESYIFGTLLAGTETMTIGEQSAEMEEGWLYVLPSNTPLEIMPHGEISYLSICMKGELKDFLQEYEPQNYFIRHNGERLIFYVSQVQGNLLESHALADELIRLFCLKKKEKNLCSDAVSHAVQYIEAHANSRYSLEALSGEVNMSKYHLAREFKKAMGVTPKRYHQQCRLRNVKKAISSHRQSDIAYQMDFSSQSHLESIFMEYMGISLGQYLSAVESESDPN